jgi:hypothetical protein
MQGSLGAGMPQHPSTRSCATSRTLLRFRPEGLSLPAPAETAAPITVGPTPLGLAITPDGKAAPPSDAHRPRDQHRRKRDYGHRLSRHV